MKKIILIIAIFLLSGCSIEYNLTINEDSSINEEILASEHTNRLESYTKLESTQACEYLYNMFKREDEDISIDCSEKNSMTNGVARTIHNDIEDYASKFTSDIIKNVEISKNDDEIILTAVQSEKLGGDSSTSYLYDKINVNISVPFKVVENNADKESDNVYTWVIEKNKKEKTIRIVYKDKELPNRANITINNNKYNLRYEYFIIGGIALVILTIIIFVLVKGKKNNIL